MINDKAKRFVEWANRVGPAPSGMLAVGGWTPILFDIVLAMDETGGIGKDGGLPWKLKGELAEFKRLTIGDGKNAVIMGRKTWESLPARPLPLRVNIVLSRLPILDLPPGTLHAQSIDEALSLAEEADRRFVIGGAQVYAEALAHTHCEHVHLTTVRGNYECDTRVDHADILTRFENVAPPRAQRDDSGQQWTTLLLGRKDKSLWENEK